MTGFPLDPFPSRLSAVALGGVFAPELEPKVRPAPRPLYGEEPEYVRIVLRTARLARRATSRRNRAAWLVRHSLVGRAGRARLLRLNGEARAAAAVAEMAYRLLGPEERYELRASYHGGLGFIR